MRKILAPAVLALALCAAGLGVLAGKHWRQPATPSIGDVPRMSVAEAVAHRETRYTALASIEQVLALPSHFARLEALYALAGRSDSARVQDLIFQANGIVDPSDRKETLLVLLERLTELDAPSALALSRTADFATDRDFEREVWQRWGGLDLDAAVSAARQLATRAHRNMAAQALFAAYGYWGNAMTTRIAELLDAPPDSRTRALYLSRLADGDPRAAIEYAKSLEPMQERYEAVMLLGRRFGRDDPRRAGEYAGWFGDLQLQRVYASSLVQSAAQAEPQAVLEAVLGEASGAPEGWGRAFTAFRELAAQDVEQALTYLDRVDNRQQREMFAGVIGQILAQQDPERALAWARDYDRGMQRPVYMQVLTTIASTDPERALSEAGSLTSSQRRREAYGMLAMTLAQRDIEQAISLVERIARPDERNQAVSTVAGIWMQSDPEAAVSWILQQAPPVRDELLSGVGRWLPQRDPDAALRLLPRVNEATAAVWRAQIAGTLAANRSLDEAQRFIAAFEGSDEYPELLSSVIGGLAQRDVGAAVQLAGTLPAGEHRDALYSGLMRQLADEDPRQAARLLESIADPGQRMNAAGQLVSSWARTDSEAAEQWVRRLPQGQERDRASAALADQWRELTPSRRRMIDEIGDPDLRRHVAFNFAWRTARSDPAQAERILQSFDLPAAEREQLLLQLEEIRKRELTIYPGRY